MTNEPASRSFWTWWVCGLLLCASTINYMDRQTLSTVSPRIKHEFDLSNEKYGNLEFGFGVAFAVILDATLIRALLVPALMRLFGERNWWAPQSMSRFTLKH